MALLSLIVALLIEQIRPLPYVLLVRNPLAWVANALEETFNAGRKRYGVIAWCLGVGGLTLLCAGVYGGLRWVNPLLGWLWTVGVLYLTMGFRRFSHYYSDIQFALRMDDLPHARQLLAQWSGYPTASFGFEQVARLAIEQALAASHRHVFGVFVWFVLLPGPCGAVLYRAAAFFAERWAACDDAESGRFCAFAKQAFAFIDWLPLRLTAAGFAVVGNFEDAVYCWRTQADKWPDGPLGRGIGIVLASGAGALGVRLGGVREDAPATESECAGHPGIGSASAGEASVDFMQSAVGLLWRALWLWLLLLLLLSSSNLFA